MILSVDMVNLISREKAHLLKGTVCVSRQRVIYMLKDYKMYVIIFLDFEKEWNLELKIMP